MYLASETAAVLHDGILRTGRLTMPGPQEPSPETLARTLDATGSFRVLRRVRRLPVLASLDLRPDLIGTAVVLDTETTGVDPHSCEVIEFAAVRLQFDRLDGRVLRVTGRYSGLQQPSAPIPAEVVRLTGLADDDVEGRSIDPDAIADVIDGADLVIAHNAAFDRPVVERHWPMFEALAWACSLKDVRWQDLGFEGGKLGHLVMQAGAFHAGHRAMDDVDALMHLLSWPVPSSGRTAMSDLIAHAALDSVRIWADGAPFRVKNDLRARGYRWSDGSRGTPRAWYRDVGEDEAGGEIGFLEEMFGRDRGVLLPMRRITARDRYSRRADRP